MPDLIPEPPHFELVTTQRKCSVCNEPSHFDGDPRWHVRMVGANGEQISRTEDYNDCRDAVHAYRLTLLAVGNIYATHDRAGDALVEVNER